MTVELPALSSAAATFRPAPDAQATAQTKEQQDASQRLYDQHQQERVVLFGNEGFALGALHTVSAAAAFGVVNQMDKLRDIAGIIAPLTSLTLLLAALAASIGAAYFRHEYKMWDIKARVLNEDAEQARRFKKANFYLGWMRELMGAATLWIVGALLILAFAMWFRVFGLF